MMVEGRNLTAKQCIYEAIANEGVRGLYKGALQPLLGAVPINSVVFTATEFCKRKLAIECPWMSSSTQSLYAGMFAGFCSLSVFVPFDLLKCRAQVTKDS